MFVAKGKICKMTKMKERIEEKLRDALDPTLLEVVNDSARHKGHAGDDGSGESHFIIAISSGSFAGCSRIECQRMVHNALECELTLIHSVSIIITK